jgi:hypothetical protein
MLYSILTTGAAAQSGESASTQAATQIWANVTLDWHKSARVMYSLDFEPKTQVSDPSGQPGWASIELTPSAEFAATKWLDLIGEGVTGVTKQTDNLRTNELALRGGARFHLFSTQERIFMKERQPKRRIVIRDLVRAESRRLSYSDGRPTDVKGRFRSRIEFLFPINHPNISDDRTFSAISDWEFYVPFTTDPSERFANKHRLRAGIEYRPLRAWQFRALYIRDRSRNTIDQPFETSENIVDLQVKRVW